MLFHLNCLKDHWIPWINLIKERHGESRNGRKREKWRKRKEEGRARERREREREREFSMSSNIYEFTVT